ncbi:MAG TPA: CaiB/BaiF CoA-transferase family protein [Gemmatimonadaceae bacterium]|nr:CaiB/BaiF CoA-transferase family protein [Gemmatimonadaceae bacterium]
MPAPNADGMPLSGVRVVALEQAVAAPFASRQLADMGADVIKIERPGGGDSARAYDSALRGNSAYFAWLNRGKRSVMLDVKRPDDHEVAARLLEEADVFVHNLAPGAVERLGFGYDDLAARNGRLVWCGISGYGPDGPLRDKKAYDMLVQAESGVVSVTGSAEEPAKVGVSMADISSGLYAYSSILAALLKRERTGRGERIDISMLECLTEWMTPALYVYQGTGAIAARVGVRHNMIVPYGAYACRDGAVLFAIQTQREWQRFCAQVMDDALLEADPRFATNADRLANRAVLEQLIERRFGEFDRATVTAWLDAADIPTGAVNDIPSVVSHVQLAARNRWTTVAGPSGQIPALVPPHNLAGAPPRMGAVPALGAHTAEVLAELGLVNDSGGER